MNIEDLLRSAGVVLAPEGHHHVRPGWIGFDCLQCSPGWLKFRCGYNTRTGRVNCWQCGRLDATRVLAILTKQPFGVIREITKGLSPRPDDVVRVGKYIEPYGLCELGDCQQAYLKTRGFDPDEIVERWHVRAFNEIANYHYKYRIFIPFEHEREIVSYTARSISEHETVRYVNCPELDEAVPMKTLLYGEDYVNNTVVVVEGPTDVWRIGPGAVATMGLVVTPQQIARIAKYPTRVLCFDNEPRAQNKAHGIATMLRAYPGRTFVVKLDAKDPGTATTKEIERLRSEFLN